MSQCEAALMSGVLVTKENIFQVVNSNLKVIFVFHEKLLHSLPKFLLGILATPGQPRQY